MRKFGILSIVTLLATVASYGQSLPSAPAGPTDEQIVHQRVGTSLDSAELAYFGLFQGQSPRVDSAHFGPITGGYYVEPFAQGRSQKVVLTPAAQNEFLRLIAWYERLALDPRTLDLNLLRPLGVQVPLLRHERNGRFAEVTLSTGTYFGELLFVSDKHIALYDVDLGYEASLVETSVKIFPIAEVTRLKIYARNLATYTGLATGAAVGVAMPVQGYSPFDIKNESAQYAVNLLVFPALGAGIGFLIDKAYGIGFSYDMKNPDRAKKGLARASKKVMFPRELPPELKRRIASAR